MSALDLDALEARCKDTIAEWTLVYAQSGETLPDDAVETKAARETLALITRLRAAEARTAWADSLALQAYSMAAAIEQADEDGDLDALGDITATIIRQDVARILEIVTDRQAAPREWRRRGRLTWMVPHVGTLVDVCAFCGHERLPYQVGGLRNGQQDPTICPACGFDKTAAAEKEHGG